MKTIEVDLDEATVEYLIGQAKANLIEVCHKESVSLFGTPETIEELQESIGKVMINDLFIAAILEAIKAE